MLCVNGMPAFTYFFFANSLGHRSRKIQIGFLFFIVRFFFVCVCVFIEKRSISAIAKMKKMVWAGAQEIFSQTEHEDCAENRAHVLIYIL